MCTQRLLLLSYARHPSELVLFFLYLLGLVSQDMPHLKDPTFAFRLLPCAYQANQGRVYTSTRHETKVSE